jgi:release factor glutamine methyltransferase
MLTLLEIVKRTTDFFAKREIESPRLNAELVVAHALGLGRMQLYLQFERLLEDAELERIRPLVRRRGQREPLAYVLGTAAFHDLVLRVDSRVLVPRPETEQLIEALEESGPPSPRRILDLGTGSGAIALALAKRHPEAEVVAVDASDAALEVARANAVDAGLEGRVEFRHSDWYSAVPEGEQFDWIAGNPPYLTEEEWSSAEPEVRLHEPRSALVAAGDGCADLLEIVNGAKARMAPGGILFLETGVEQHPRLIAAMEAAGFAEARSHTDWSGRDRFVSARRPS